MTSLAKLHVDDALTELTESLAGLAKMKDAGIPVQKSNGCEVWLPSIALKYWAQQAGHGIPSLVDSSSLREHHLDPFADAAWYLCRMGVLRPGPSADRAGHSTGSLGYGFTLTGYGLEWVRTATERLPLDPSRFADLLTNISRDFGEAFLPRAREAAACYRTGNYLACCAMAGAAAEAILLSVASAKAGSADEALRTYRSSGGRDQTVRRIAGSVSKNLSADFSTLSGIVGYWRDEAAHGANTSISEVEASMALSQLLRFAQLTHDRWADLIGR